ncbi:protein-glutamate O-methyltransferase CheR [Nisaea acidiphila]|uniref:protein-glutamate O-methyltransferase n=1 Tax=Nisaea acidiphila TaxID=1862145 RepID=A0A9J7AV59_9PROT|nr:protein-glutamate O-methyltransferase CheR [Nisaea acidiphila]UUX50690.1 protein-glutamate O-methyltransferase CheR [Nisaea acidiphila]
MENTDLIQAEFEELRRLAHHKFGIIVPANAESFLDSRLRGFMSMSGHGSIPELLRDARSDGREDLLINVVEHLSTNHSYFYREPAHFEFLTKTLLPELQESLRKSRSRDIRVWSAAAAAGEEAYSVVMAMREYFGPHYQDFDAGVLATDIATAALRRGTLGEYRSDQFRHMPPLWREKYLEYLGDDAYRVVKPVRDDVMFRWLNLTESLDMLRGRYHLILCRNVMIYFDDMTRENLVRNLANLLAPGGYLFIGHTDNPDHARIYLDQVRPAIFRKKAKS